MSLGPRPLTAAQPGLVTAGVFVTGGQVPLGAIKDVANGIVAPDQAPLADLSFVVGDPMPDLKFHHLAFAIWQVELKGAIERVRSLLIIIKRKVATDGRDPMGELNTQPPARHVHLMNTLVAQVSVAGIPNPVPVVMKPITGEGL